MHQQGLLHHKDKGYKVKILIAMIALVTFLQGCTLFDPVKIQYVSYEPITNRYKSGSDSKEYGVFFKYEGEKIEQRITQPLGLPLLGCKIKLSQNGQQKIEYINGTIRSFPVDDKYTFLARLDFSDLNINKDFYLKGYLFEDENFYLVDDPICRIIYKGNFEDYGTDTMTIPKQDITKPKLILESEQK